AIGATALQVPAGSWVSKSDNAGSSSVAFKLGETTLHGDSASPQTFQAGVTLPSSLQGRPVKVTGFELCYDSGDLAVVDEVFLDRTRATQSFSEAETMIDDTTDRTDTTCR